MDLPAIIAQHLAAQAAKPRPDRPPMTAGPLGPAVPPMQAGPQPGYITRKVNGRWVIVPVNGGNKDPRLAPRIFVKPLKRG